MDFPDALKECLQGKRITNENWNGKGMYVFMLKGDEWGILGELENTVKMPVLMMKNAKSEIGPWLISQMDVFSTGWKVVE